MTVSNKDENLAPVVLFVYNRPEHTGQTLKALAKNRLAEKSTLYIYSDGPRKGDEKKVEEVRTLIRQEAWCGDVHIMESATNNGLAASIKNGVSTILKEKGKVIVLEDDLVTSPAFLTYMNRALDFYNERKSVFSISGYCLPAHKMEIPDDYPYDVFACLRNSSWGWATWDDRWQQVDWSVSHYKTLAENEAVKEAFGRMGDDVFSMLHDMNSGKLDIWSIQFTLAHFVNHAISIVPVKSYVDNIGMDGTGENCRVSDGLRNLNLNEKTDLNWLDVIYQDKRIINAFYNAYCRKKRPIPKKMINYISRKLGGSSIFTIKKKIYD